MSNFRKLSKNKQKSSRFRHLYKTISWRIIGSLDTWFLASFVTQSSEKGGYIAIAEVFTKMLFYYLHERIWYKMPFGLKDGQVLPKRNVAKTITWRVVGTLDTILLAWIISGNPWAGLTIGGLELITKMILYYLHERAWVKIDLKYFNEKAKS